MSLGGCATEGESFNGSYEDATYSIRLPSEEARLLVFEGEGSIEYFIDATTENYQLYAQLTGDNASALASADEVLRSHTFEELSSSRDIGVIEAELKAAFADAFYGQPGAPTDIFSSLTLHLAATPGDTREL